MGCLQGQMLYHLRSSVELTFTFCILHLLSFFQCSDCTAFKLASITSLYVAAKVHNQKPLSMTSLSNLSGGEFLVEDIKDMETVLLKALDWQMCPPTASSFCGHFYALLPTKINETISQTLLLQRSLFFCELAVMDYSLMVSINQSELAFAGILNSLAGVSSSLMSIKTKDNFIKGIERCSGMDHKSGRIQKAQEKLFEIYHKSAQYKVIDSKNKHQNHRQNKRDGLKQHKSYRQEIYTKGSRSTLSQNLWRSNE